MVAVCTQNRSNTFIVNDAYSSIDNKSQLSSVRDIMRKLVPPVDNCNDKTNTTESSHQGNTVSHETMSTVNNFTDTMRIQNVLKGSMVTNLNDEAYTTMHVKSQLTRNYTSLRKYKRSMLMQNTSRNAPESEDKYLLTTSQPNDMEIMQRQLNLTQCLLFYVEKEKTEYAEMDLWRIYTALRTIPPNVTTVTEKYIISVTESLTGWNNNDSTINEQIANKLASTINTVQQMKNFLSVTDVNVMRTVQYGYKFDDQLLLKQLLNNYKSENALLHLKYELQIRRPTVSPTSDIAELVYYPLLQRYVSLLVDTSSARTACLQVRSLF